MRNLKKYIFIILLVVLFIEIIIIFPHQIKNSKSNVLSSEKAISDAHAETQRMNGVHLIESKLGARDWELYAEKATGNQGKKAWTLSKVKVEFYNENNKEFEVTGERGSVDSKTKDLIIEGNVLTKSFNGYTMLTQKITYDSTSRKIYSPSQVRIVAPREANSRPAEFSGDQMEISVDNSTILISGNIKGIHYKDRNKFYRINSDKLTLSSRAKDAKFSSNVVVVYEGNTLKSNECEFNFNNSNNLFLVKLTGEVTFNNLDRKASAQKMEIYNIENRFVLTGSPKVIQNEDVLTGEEIVFLDGGKKVRINKVRADIDKTKLDN